ATDLEGREPRAGSPRERPMLWRWEPARSRALALPAKSMGRTEWHAPPKHGDDTQPTLRAGRRGAPKTRESPMLWRWEPARSRALALSAKAWHALHGTHRMARTAKHGTHRKAWHAPQSMARTAKHGTHRKAWHAPHACHALAGEVKAQRVA